MKKLAPFIPIIGIFLTGYFHLYKREDTGIGNYGKIYWSSALVQAISVFFLMVILLN